jgi:hypothetical protein
VIDPYLDDRDALEAAIDIVRKHRERWQELLNLAWERGWQEAAAVAAYDAQCRSMRLPPWEKPPCAASVRGKDRAARLLRRMLKRKISKFHPRPLEAIAAAGTALDANEKGLAITETPGASSAA